MYKTTHTSPRSCTGVGCKIHTTMMQVYCNKAVRKINNTSNSTFN